MTVNKRKKNSDHSNQALGLDIDITRRDFIGGTLAGFGSALLMAGSPKSLGAGFQGLPPSNTLGPDWTGPGGVGDYTFANGNTHDVVNAAHDFRNGAFDKALPEAVDTGETYDVVVVGGGFGGFGAAYTLHSDFEGRKSCLILDNHNMYGGGAKQNEFIVDGHHIYAQQASCTFGTDRLNPSFPAVWHELGLPTDFNYVPLSGTDKPIRFARDTYTPMRSPESASIGYLFNTKNGNQWAIDPQLNDFRDTPFSHKTRSDLVNAFNHSLKPKYDNPSEEWLDSITYRELLVNELGLSQEAFEILDYSFASDAVTASGDVCSAHYAYICDAPGTRVLSKKSMFDGSNREIHMLPAGNAGIMRHFVRKLVPDAFASDATFEDTVVGPTNIAALDKPGNSTRIRLASTAINIVHDNSPEQAKHVYVTYHKNGRLERVRAKSVVVAANGHIAKHIISDLPNEIRAAYDQFYHSPQLIVNVALRNWRFMESIGISVARWFDGFGWFATLRQPMASGEMSAPHDPSKPAVLTLCVPFLNYRGKSIREQTALGRYELYGRNFYDYEVMIRDQLVRLFADHGFDPRRDIAGIILNRWGHAAIAPAPGFNFGAHGQRSPREVVAEGYGRISFGHSEVHGVQSWITGFERGAKAMRQLKQL